MNAARISPNAPGAQAVADVQTIAAVVSRAPGHTCADLMVLLADGSLLHVQRVRLAPATFGIAVLSSPEALHFNTEQALNRESQRIRSEVLPDVNGLTDESVLAEFEESYQRAHAQLFGGAR